MNEQCNEVLDYFNVLMRFVKSEMNRLKIFGAVIPRIVLRLFIGARSAAGS